MSMMPLASVMSRLAENVTGLSLIVMFELAASAWSEPSPFLLNVTVMSPVCRRMPKGPVQLSRWTCTTSGFDASRVRVAQPAGHHWAAATLDAAAAGSCDCTGEKIVCSTSLT
jgi:hypothetical protein